MDRTQRTGQGWRLALALLLAAVFGLQGCSAVSTSRASSTTSTSLVASEGKRVGGGALRYLEGEPRAAGGSLLPVCCNFGAPTKGEGAALIGILILASPLLIAAAVVAVPFLILGAPLLLR